MADPRTTLVSSRVPQFRCTESPPLIHSRMLKRTARNRRRLPNPRLQNAKIHRYHKLLCRVSSHPVNKHNHAHHVHHAMREHACGMRMRAGQRPPMTAAVPHCTPATPGPAMAVSLIILQHTIAAPALRHGRAVLPRPPLAPACERREPGTSPTVLDSSPTTRVNHYHPKPKTHLNHWN